LNNAYGYITEQNEENLGWYVFDGTTVIGGPFDTQLAAENYAVFLARKRMRDEEYEPDGPGL